MYVGLARPERFERPPLRFVAWSFGVAITIAIISLYFESPSDFYAIAIQIPHEHWIALSRLARVGFHVENPIWLEAWESAKNEMAPIEPLAPAAPEAPGLTVSARFEDATMRLARPASINQLPCRLGRPTCRGFEAIASKSSPPNIDQSISLGSSKFASSRHCLRRNSARVP